MARPSGVTWLVAALPAIALVLSAGCGPDVFPFRVPGPGDADLPLLPPDGGDGGSTVGGGGEEDPACIPEHDPRHPRLRARFMDVYLPLGIAIDAIRDLLQALIDSEQLNFLIAIDWPDDDGPPTLRVARGLALGEGAFAFDPEVEPFETEVEVAGRRLRSLPGTLEETEVRLPSPVGLFRVPLHQGLLEATFTTEERCSIGSEAPEGAVTEWVETGRVTAKITISDALATEFHVGSLRTTLCDWLSGGGLSHGCERPREEWENPPDTTLDGEDAWNVDVRIALTAVVLVE